MQQNQSDIERESLLEKLEHRQTHIETLEASSDNVREQLKLSRKELEQARLEQVRLKERATRVPELISALEKAKDGAAESARELSNVREKVGAAESTVTSQKTQIQEGADAVARMTEFRDALLEEKEELHARLATLEAELEAEQKQSQEKLELLNVAKNELSHQFKAVANDILETKSKNFTEQNKEILQPFQTKLGDLQRKVENFYSIEGKERSAMAEQIRQVMDMNKQLSADANNLTRALKGQSKAQGNWGEMILERVLEMSGLRKGDEYEVQESFTLDNGRRSQPDVVVHLPENRHLIIDAKASLTAYEAYVNAETEAAQKTAIKRHLDSIHAHINNLSSKDYQSLYGVESLDFVIMFIPVEPAFTLASHKDATLWQNAWNKNILLVSPSTLLFVIRTVAHLWRQEQQNRNAQEIANRGAELYNKFVGFVEDLTKVGERLNQARTVYDTATKKLSTGRGNLVRQAELLKDLGIKPKKDLPHEVVTQSIEEGRLEG
ncbi:DNA recombination protein RmuC [Pseudodesulfovibrio sp. JC047]|nr:DNA recombination protein RmuC [Pseudodesulfovibrio sp. JC047]